MSRKRVVIELLPNRIDVVPWSGGRPGTGRRLAVALDVEVAAWPQAVAACSAELERAVADLGLAGATATVLYRSPTQAVDFSSHRMKRGEARNVARIACLDALATGGAATVSGAAAVASAGAMTHVVAAADLEPMLGGMVELVEAAGLRLRTTAPLRAAVLAAIVRSMLAKKSGLHGCIYLGDHSAIFVVVDDGALVFARQLSIGLAMIADSLTRPIPMGDGPPVELDAARAREILHAHGRPARDEVVDEVLGLTGDRVGPLMQPILQRLVIELRQSLRFGLATAQRESITLRLTGSGAGVPGLAALLAEELDVAIEADADDARHDWRTPGAAGGELATALEAMDVADRIGLLPTSYSADREDRRVRRWLWTGAAAAIAMIAVDAGRAHVTLRDVQRQIDAAEAEAAGQEALATTRERLGRLVGAARDLESLVAAEIGAQPDVRAMLHEIAALTPSSVRLTEIELQRQDGRTTGGVSGFAAAEGGAGLQAYIGRLARSPLLADVRLATVQMGEMNGRAGERFEAAFTVRAVPAPAVLVDAGGEASP